MANESRGGNSRVKYGRCINEECEMCSSDIKHPIVQEIPGRRDFVCAKCGHELRECLPPSSWWGSNKKWVIPVGIVAVLGIGGGVYWATNSTPSNSDANTILMPDTTVQQVDTPIVQQTEIPVQQVDTPAVQQPEAEPTPIIIYGGEYKGELKDQQPTGSGTITYQEAKTVTVGALQFQMSEHDLLLGEFQEGKISGPVAYWVHHKGQYQDTIQLEPQIAYGGVYIGNLRDGKPNGGGTVTYTTATSVSIGKTQISAKPGDKLIGTFKNDGTFTGKYVTWRHADTNTTEQITIEADKTTTSGETTVTAYGGKYSGEKKNGKPHGNGTVSYTKATTVTVGSTVINVKAGDKLEGEFRDGRLSGGYAYLKHADGRTEAIKL